MEQAIKLATVSLINSRCKLPFDRHMTGDSLWYKMNHTANDMASPNIAKINFGAALPDLTFPRLSTISEDTPNTCWARKVHRSRSKNALCFLRPIIIVVLWLIAL